MPLQVWALLGPCYKGYLRSQCGTVSALRLIEQTDLIVGGVKPPRVGMYIIYKVWNSMVFRDKAACERTPPDP